MATDSFKIAAVQASSVFLDLAATVDKACGLMLLRWENYMPLARYSLIAQGAQIHVAPTWDRGEPWISTMRHVAKEGRCFVIGACQAFHKDDVPDALDLKTAYLGDLDGWINPGLSLIVDPDGKIVAGPLEAQEGIMLDPTYSS